MATGSSGSSYRLVATIPEAVQVNYNSRWCYVPLILLTILLVYGRRLDSWHKLPEGDREIE